MILNRRSPEGDQRRPPLYPTNDLEDGFSEGGLPFYGVLGSTHGLGPRLKIPTDALWALRREATGAAGFSTFREQMLISRQMLCRQAQAAGPGVRKRSLTGRRRALGDLAPQEDDPGRCEAQLNPLGALPAFVPARILADLWVEPDARTFWLEHPFVGRVVLRVVQRRSRRCGDRCRYASGTIAPKKGSSRGRWRSTRRCCPPQPSGGCHL